MKARLDDKKLGEALKSRKYYYSGIRSDYDTLSIELEEFYHGRIVDKLLALHSAGIEFESPKHLENAIYENFKNAFLDAVRFTKAEKRQRVSIDINDYIEYYGEGDGPLLPEALKHEDADFDSVHVDEIDLKMKMVKELLSVDEYNYLDLRLNAQCSVNQVMEIMRITKNRADRLLKDIKRKCKHLRTEGFKYSLTPYGEVDSRNTLESFHMSEHASNQYINYVSTNKLAIHVEDVAAFDS